MFKENVLMEDCHKAVQNLRPEVHAPSRTEVVVFEPSKTKRSQQ
jgi:hypothetical protein